MEQIHVDTKAAGDPIAGMITYSTSPRIEPHGYKPSGILDLITRVNSPSTSIVFTQTVYPYTNNAAFILEAAAKPENQPRWTGVLRKLEEVATWCSVTVQALDDVVGLQRTLDVDLTAALDERIADRVINGTGTTPDILGILATPNIITVAYVATTNILDMLISGINQVQSAGYGTVNGIVMNPTDIASLTITKTASGVQYIRPAELPTVVSDAHLAVGTAIVGDFRFATLYTRGVKVVSGHQMDDITKDKVTLAASERVGLAISRPQAFAKVALA
jgi:HK97 family phage major capsid protein